MTNTPRRTAGYATHAAASSEWRTASMIPSFEKKPEKPGKPMRARVPTSEHSQVIGMRRQSPPMRRMSCSWWRAMMTEPAARKRSALKKAWVPRWKTAAA